MAPSLFRVWLALRIFVWVAVLSAVIPAGWGELSIPTRPTSFPLSGPQLAGEVVAWGSNTFGQVTVPAGLTNVVAIAAGRNHNLALRNDGTVVAWGDNRFGQCNVPAGLTNVVSIVAGAAHSLALKMDGRVVAWGTNDTRTSVPSSLRMRFR
jgi:hypothetical protein